MQADLDSGKAPKHVEPVAEAAPPIKAGDEEFEWVVAANTPAPPGKAAEPAAATPAVQGDGADQQKKYGLRPKRYAKLLDGQRNDGDGYDETLADRERRVMAALPGIVKHLNDVAKQRGLSIRFTEAELVTNFISEGGYFLLNPLPGGGLAEDTNIDGYQYLGIDTFMSRKAKLDPWMSDDLRARANSSNAGGNTTNEKGESVEYLNPATLEQGVEANAVMFAGAREQLSKDAKALNLSISAPEAWFFWTTIYYNCGEGTGKKLLKQHGVDYWKQKWTLPDDNAKYNRSAKFNATWRTSTWDAIRSNMGDDLDAVKPKADAEPGPVEHA